MQKKIRNLVLLLVFLSMLIQSAYAGEERRFKPRFSLKLTCGWGDVAIGDINKCLETVNNNKTFSYYREHCPDLIVGEIKTLDTSLSDWEAEFIVDITPRISLGIATSAPFQRTNESSLTYTSTVLQTHSYTYRPKIEVFMPVKLSVYYGLPIFGKMKAFLNGGVGVYTGKMSEFFKLEVTPPGYPSDWMTRYWETARKSYLGFHGGAGIEYSLAKRLALLVEVRLRYAVIKNFWGCQLNVSKYEYVYYGQIGYLYYHTKEDLFLGARYADLQVWEEPPELSIDFTQDIRKAVLDLSGYSFRIGIRIGLF